MKKRTPIQQILEDWAMAWEEEFGRKYLIEWGKDGQWANKLIEMCMSPDEYAERRGIYFESEWYREHARCSFAAFVNNINKFVPLKKRRNGEQPFCSKCFTNHLPSKSCEPAPSIVNEVAQRLTVKK